jgi:hypothetical protein
VVVDEAVDTPVLARPFGREEAVASMSARTRCSLLPVWLRVEPVDPLAGLEDLVGERGAA